MDSAPLDGLATSGHTQEGRRMTVIEALAFGLAVQFSAGVVVLINVVMSRVEQAGAERFGGE